MHSDLARELLKNLLERATTSDERTFLTSSEMKALAVLLEVEQIPSASSRSTTPRITAEIPKVVKAQLDVTQIKDSDIPENAMLCVDFGTSFSKSFATVGNGATRPELIDLPIGDGSTGNRLTTQSELMIDDGRIYLGPSARQRLENTQASPDRLIDSIKQFITLNSDVSTLGSEAGPLAGSNAELFEA